MTESETESAIIIESQVKETVLYTLSVYSLSKTINAKGNIIAQK